MAVMGISAVMTLGDPCGVGPELALEALDGLGTSTIAIMGSSSWVEPLLASIRQHNPQRASHLEEILQRRRDQVRWVNVGESPYIGTVGEWSPRNIGFIDACLRGGAALAKEQGCGLVTGPVDKRFFGALGMKDSGHTEYLVRLFEKPATMYFDSPQCRLALMTRHIPLCDVTSRVEKWLLRQTVEHVVACQEKGQSRSSLPLVVVGVDPHCGEWGLISDVDRRVRDWVTELSQEGLPVEGPISADTAFLPETRAKYSACLCWYHDQGMIPVKLLGFEDAVNATLGLPVFRTSPAHGVAYDRAWKGVSRSGSFRRALEVAVSGGF